MADGHVRTALAGHSGWTAVQAIPGVGPVLAAVFVAEIDDIDRFASARHLCSRARLTPKHHDSTPRSSGVGSPSRDPGWCDGGDRRCRTHRDFLRSDYRRIATRRNNRNIARVAVARKIVTLVYYGLRDGEIRCLAQEAA